MVSKAISGVKRPVLPIRERTSHRAQQRRGRRRERQEGWVKRRVLITKKSPRFLFIQHRHPTGQRGKEDGATEAASKYFSWFEVWFRQIKIKTSVLVSRPTKINAVYVHLTSALIRSAKPVRCRPMGRGGRDGERDGS